MKDKIGQIINLTGKYTMEISKLKHIQRYINNFELEYRKFEQPTQRHQRTTKSHFTTEEVFETLEIANVDMSKYHSTIDPVFKSNFGNNFHHKNIPNQRQHVHKNTIQQYKYRSYQIPRTSSITYLK